MNKKVNENLPISLYVLAESDQTLWNGMAAWEWLIIETGNCELLLFFIIPIISTGH